MPSHVGEQTAEVLIVQQVVALEMDCVAALAEAADRTSDAGDREIFARCAAECLGHIRAWQKRLRALGGSPGKLNRGVAWLNRTKVKLAAPFGPQAIASAITNNPTDCMAAYARVAQRVDLSQTTRDLANQMLRDAILQSAMVRNTPR